MLVYYKDLINVVKRYLSKDQLKKLETAYLFAKKAHTGQTRASGEPFIHHPLAVALNLAIIKASIGTLIAGLLHDVVEDCGISLDDIKKKFGSDIANLVDGVTKINSLTNTSETKLAATNIKKVLLSGVSDVRVLIIKLCDRMHNISTLSALPKEKRTRIAKETLEIYRPIALKLSLFDINKVLEDEAFKWAYPQENDIINLKLASVKKQAWKLHGKILLSISEALVKNNIKDANVQSREKTNFAIYNKIYKKGKRWEKLFDILAVRVIVKDVKECFTVLGILHKTFKHLPRTFKDYITIPKTNGYQSLHTCISYDGFVFEAQIRTEAMDKKANIGIASIWEYKDAKESMMKEIKENHSWLLDAKHLSTEQLEAAKFVENFYSKITSSSIYTLTPNNDIIIMPRGSTVLDFAYRIHTRLGNHFKWAEVNNQKVGFDHILENGSVIKIFTSDTSQVIERWLSVVKTKNAHSKINESLKTLKMNFKQDFEKIGKLIFYNFFTEKQLNKINIKNIKNIFGINVNSIEDVYEAAGRKILSIEDILKIKNNSITATKRSGFQKSISVDDSSFNGIIKRAGCCAPIPGELIKSTLKNKTLTIHKQTCAKAIKISKINAIWKSNSIINEFFDVKIKIEYEENNLGLNRIIHRIIRNKINIIQIKKYIKNNFVELVILVPNIGILGIVISSIESLPYVKSVMRKKDN